MAWPLKNREVVYHVIATDMLEEEGCIAVVGITETPEENPDVPEVPPGFRRIDFEADILIRGCPPDHPLLKKSNHTYPEGEEVMLITLKNFVDAHVSFVPLTIINFVTRTFMSKLWSQLLQVAEEIRGGKRPEHEEAIRTRRDIYEFVESRLSEMVKKVKENSKSKPETKEEENSKPMTETKEEEKVEV